MLGTITRNGCRPVLLATVLLALCVTPLLGRNVPRVAPPQSMAYGKSLTEWLGIYWRWFYTGADPAQGKVGNVQLMPLPVGEQVSGDWTPESPALLVGRLEITLRPGTPFVLPEFAWVGERYEGYPEVPDDVPMADALLLASLYPTLTIDGRVVMSDANKADYYVPATAFDPVIEYAEPTGYGSVAALYFQGCGMVLPPLSVGVHEIHLYEPFILGPDLYPVLPAGIGLIYDNTWIVTVVDQPED